LTVADRIQSNSNRAFDTVNLWAEVGQKVTQQLLELSAASAKDGLKLVTEIQAANIDAVRDNVAFASTPKGSVEDWQRNPGDWYRTSVLSGIEQAQKSFRVLEGNAQALTRYAESLSSTATEATSKLQEAYETVAERFRADASVAGITTPTV
jgi:hypothetical protein